MFTDLGWKAGACNMILYERMVRSSAMNVFLPAAIVCFAAACGQQLCRREAWVALRSFFFVLRSGQQHSVAQGVTPQLLPQSGTLTPQVWVEWGTWYAKASTKLTQRGLWQPGPMKSCSRRPTSWRTAQRQSTNWSPPRFAPAIKQGMAGCLMTFDLEPISCLASRWCVALSAGSDLQLGSFCCSLAGKEGISKRPCKGWSSTCPADPLQAPDLDCSDWISWELPEEKMSWTTHGRAWRSPARKSTTQHSLFQSWGRLICHPYKCFAGSIRTWRINTTQALLQTEKVMTTRVLLNSDVSDFNADKGW